MMQANPQETIRTLVDLLEQADAVLVGVGSGMSSAAGYNHYHWMPAMEGYLKEFRAQYGFPSPFAGFYYAYSSYEEQWAYYARYLTAMYELPIGKPYLDLADILQGKDYFILTSNVDTQCERVFPAERICDFQGNVWYLQCSQPCHDAIYEGRAEIQKLNQAIQNLRVPRELVPRCLQCGRVMIPWVRDDTFLEGAAWKAGAARYQRFLRRYLVEQPEKRLLLLELGVGEMTLSVIKLPFWELATRNPQVFYVCVNARDASIPEHLRGKGLYCQGDLAEQLSEIKTILRERKRSYEPKV